MTMVRTSPVGVLVLSLTCLARGPAAAAAQPASAIATIDGLMEHYRLDAHIPGSDRCDGVPGGLRLRVGFTVATDCELGLTLSHGGGYPGYGSHVLLLADYGIGIFALANRTYAGPRTPVWEAAVALLHAGQLEARPAAVSTAPAVAYAAATKIFEAGSVTAAGDGLAMNFLMDRDAEHWAKDIAGLKAQVGRVRDVCPHSADGPAVG